MDLLARTVTSALVLSHDIRDAVRVHLVFDDTFTVTFDGSQLRNFNPDERSTAARILDALSQRAEAIGRVPVETSPGVSLTRRGFAPTVEALASDGTVIELHENGAPPTAADPPENPIFILSDHEAFTAAEAETVATHRDARLSLSSRTVHADHAVTLAHQYLDTAGYERF
jgi:tRNA (pseudouridine54-N1)-methyltransferase